MKRCLEVLMRQPLPLRPCDQPALSLAGDPQSKGLAAALMASGENDTRHTQASFPAGSWSGQFVPITSHLTATEGDVICPLCRWESGGLA